MQYLIFTAPTGQNVQIGQNNNIKLVSFDGLGELNADANTAQSPFQDGTTFLDAYMSDRPMTIEGLIRGKDDNEISDFRNLLSRTFNPKQQGDLTMYYGDKAYEIVARAESTPVFAGDMESQGKTHQRFIINLIAHEPYWTDATDMKKSLAAYRQSLTLPFEMPALMGVEGQSDVLINDGHVATPIHIEFYGPSTNPVITNETTGEFIKVYRELASDEKLIIDTGFNRKRVVIEKNGVETNAYGYVDWFESDFITLIPGENSISYKADVGTEDAIVSIEYRQRYLGV